MADLAHVGMRRKIGRLEEAFAGLTTSGFDDHHRFLLTRMLARVDQIDADIAAVDAEIEANLGPSVTRLR